MKIFVKIVLILAIGLVAFFVFYPKKYHKPSITGQWTVNSMTVNGRVKVFNQSVSITGDRLIIDELSLYTVEHQYKAWDDSIRIFKGSNSILSNGYDNEFEGTYKISLRSKITGGGTKASRDTELELKSGNKNITLYRTEPVEWKTGPLKGLR